MTGHSLCILQTRSVKYTLALCDHIRNGTGQVTLVKDIITGD
jgi:hypothetical protein